jgi:alanyl-tRNA synthetase
MQYKTTNEIRSLFLNYFKKNNHKIVPSSPLIPYNDSSLMFVNSGMVQFKNIFTGEEKVDLKTASSSQKCIRAGGKHNDLDNVGFTARHHTFFEMLGNFSFGDYFKEQAIKLAWDFLTQELCLPKDKLYVTVYHDDIDAFNLWKKIAGFTHDRIIKISTNDNFWSMGDLGPCGPCSEIFYDHGDKIFGGLPGTKDADGDRFVEIWNLVFMQYEQLEGGKRINLPKQSIDTGMGLERISAVVQNLHNNYEIDLFRNLIAASEELSKNKINNDNQASHRIIADHLRSSGFLIADGVMPSNEGRGYVLRRIMRRAMRHVHQLGVREPMMNLMAPYLIKEMGDSYPELIRAKDLIIEVIKQEEEKFGATLSKGLKLLDTELSSLDKGSLFSGEAAFKLYDTYGFPLDITKDIVEGKNIKLDEAGFEVCMKKQKELARKSWVGSGEKIIDEIWFDIYNQYGATEFLGYSNIKAIGNVIAIIEDGKHIEIANAGDKEIIIITNQTPFYGESGGQMGDIGIVTNDKDLMIEVIDTKKYLGTLHAHVAIVKRGSIEIGSSATLIVDQNHRNELKNNHSATHILHYVMRKRLGSHITQKGSLVSSQRLRFDIANPRAITKEELLLIERDVNDIIRTNTLVDTSIMSVEGAISKGAMALFGEKYNEEVRVVSMGPIDNHSIELCGGTHVNATGDIGCFKIISEGAIASGVRRIEAVTGKNAIELFQQQQKQLDDIAETIKSSKTDIIFKIQTLIKDKKDLEKNLANLKQKQFAVNDTSLVEQINQIKFVSDVSSQVEVKDIRKWAEDLNKKHENSIVIVVSTFGEKSSIAVSISDCLTDKFNAVELVKIAALKLGGAGGGGKLNLAQAGGPDIIHIQDAIIALKNTLR